MNCGDVVKILRHNLNLPSTSYATMFFRNAIIYKIGQLPSHADFEAALQSHAFVEPTSIEEGSSGLVQPRADSGLVYVCNRQWLLQFKTCKKLMPKAYINKVTKARAAELKEQQGFPPGKKQTKEIKEQVIQELLPVAMPIDSSFYAWIDPVNGWLVVDVASASKAEALLKVLFKAVSKFPLETLRTTMSPASAMTDWIVSDEAPSGFTVDQNAELKSTGHGKGRVRYVNQTLDVADTRRHIEAGKQCTKLALTWGDKVSFTLHENASLRSIAPLDVLKNDNAVDARNDEERFMGEFTLMTGEMHQLISALIDSLGGLLKNEEPLQQAA
jgi:recombination associated protein RdgC